MERDSPLTNVIATFVTASFRLLNRLFVDAQCDLDRLRGGKVPQQELSELTHKRTNQG